MEGWELTGGVFGLVHVDRAAEGDAANGLSWSSDRVSYVLGDGPAAGEDLAVAAAEFIADAAPTAAARASFSLCGSFGVSAAGPEMAGCRMVCVDHAGWGEWFGLAVGFYGLPAAVGTAADPRLRFQGQAEVTVLTDGSSGCRIGFAVDVNRFGQIEVVSYEFEAGAAAVTTGSLFQLYYDARPFTG
jgi:hypothetical protein